MSCPAENITRHFGGSWYGNYGAIPTPGHSAKDRGTTVRMGRNGEVLFYSHNDPSFDWRDFMEECRRLRLVPPLSKNTDGVWRETGKYVYRDVDGTVIYRTLRKEKIGEAKRFSAQRLEDSQWVGGLGQIERVPYRLPELLSGDKSAPVYFVEGERKADKLVGWGLAATAIPFGAKGWKSYYGKHFAGRNVVILPDNDEPGRGFAEMVKADLIGVASSVVVLDLPGLPLKGDIMDWGGSIDELRSLTATALMAPGAKQDATARTTIVATPFVWVDPKVIEPRPWVYGRWLLRNTITAVVAPGGVGKSALMASTVLALASGYELLGKTIWNGPQRVWYWNLEDDGDELARQIHAAAMLHGVNPEDCGDRLFCR